MLAKQNNRLKGYEILNELKVAMYENARVCIKRDFKEIDEAAQKSIKDVQKKLKEYEEKANHAISFGATIDCTIEEVSGAAQEARSAARRVEKLIDEYSTLVLGFQIGRRRSPDPRRSKLRGFRFQ